MCFSRLPSAFRRSDRSSPRIPSVPFPRLASVHTSLFVPRRARGQCLSRGYTNTNCLHQTRKLQRIKIDNIELMEWKIDKWPPYNPFCHTHRRCLPVCFFPNDLLTSYVHRDWFYVEVTWGDGQVTDQVIKSSLSLATFPFPSTS